MKGFITTIRPWRLWQLCRLWALAATAALLLGGPPASAVAPPVLLAVGDLRGEIEPCGCSPEGQMGGLPRRLSYLARALGPGRASTVLVDLGNNFPPSSPQGKLKVALIQEMLGRFAPDAILPGPSELALGIDALAPSALEKPLPYLLSNDEIGKFFQTQRTVQRAGVRIGIFGYLSPREVYQKSQRRFRLLPAGAALLKSWRATIKAQGHQRTVLLFRGNDTELEAFARSGIFDVIVAGNPHADEMNQVVTRSVAGRRIPQVPTKGQGLLRLKLEKGATATVDWLTDKYADHPDAREAFQRYDAQVKKLFFAKLETMQKQKADSPFMGAQACKECHGAPYAVWGASRHATAVETLEKVGKQFDPECLTCHVVGLGRGGFLSKDLTPQLAGVQCENCHGPGRAHGLNPKANRTGFDPRREGGAGAKVGEATCRNCHLGSHSPSFDFKTYWPRIQHSSTATHGTAANDAAR